MNRNLLLFTIMLLIFALFTSWLTLHFVKSNTTEVISKPHDPDSFMLNANYLKMDADGLPTIAMSSPKVIHYPYQDSAAFEKPQIIVMQKKGNPWQITADNGNSSQGTSIINLFGNVKLHQAPSKENRELTVTTTKATVYLHAKTAETDQPVKMEQPGVTVTAVGAKADFNKKTVELLSKVHEVFIPQ